MGRFFTSKQDYIYSHQAHKNSTFVEIYLTKFDIFFTEKNQYKVFRLKRSKTSINYSKI